MEEITPEQWATVRDSPFKLLDAMNLAEGSGKLSLGNGWTERTKRQLQLTFIRMALKFADADPIDAFEPLLLEMAGDWLFAPSEPQAEGAYGIAIDLRNGETRAIRDCAFEEAPPEAMEAIHALTYAHAARQAKTGIDGPDTHALVLAATNFGASLERAMMASMNPVFDAGERQSATQSDRRKGKKTFADPRKSKAAVDAFLACKTAGVSPSAAVDRALAVLKREHDIDTRHTTLKDHLKEVGVWPDAQRKPGSR